MAYYTRPISESHLIKYGKFPWADVFPKIGSDPMDEDMTDLEMYVLFSPFGRIAPRGASARIDKDRTTPGSRWVPVPHQGPHPKKVEQKVERCSTLFNFVQLCSTLFNFHGSQSQ